MSNARQRLAPLLITLAAESDYVHGIAGFDLSDATLFMADRAIGSDWLAAHALSLAHGSTKENWHIHRSPGGKPYGICDGLRFDTISMTGLEGTIAVAVATSGSIGLDCETVERVARHADPADSWLSGGEKMAVGGTMRNEIAIELTCRWVLKEAFGKATGLGLGYDLAALSFAVEENRIVARSRAMLSSWQGYRFDLYRIGRFIFALARSDND